MRGLQERVSEHARKHGILGRNIRKYGLDNFAIEILDEAESIEELNKKEYEWILRENTMKPNGYNLCYGGGNTIGFEHRPESKRAMSEAKKFAYLKAGNPFYGRKHSDDTRDKMKAAWDADRKSRLVEMSRQRNRMVLGIKVRNIDTGEIFPSIMDAAEHYSIKPTHITRVCRGRRKRTGGFKWEYVDMTIPSQAD